MMVVMLVLTIILAAFAPLMTKRRLVDTSSPWRYSTNNQDIYFGLAGKQTAMIGQDEEASGEPDSRLLINTASQNQRHLLLKGGGTETSLWLKGNNFLLGGKFEDTWSGNNNTVLGFGALTALTTGSNNSAFGTDTLKSLTVGNKNIAIGYQALRALIQGDGNVALGYHALEKLNNDNDWQSNNTAIGNEALANLRRDKDYDSGSGYPSDTGNTAVGAYSLTLIPQSSYNTAIGANAMGNAAGYSTDFNTAVGFEALNHIKSANNTALGFRALSESTSGAGNVGIGSNVLLNNKTGTGNVGIGSSALQNNIAGYNLGIGYQALLNNTDTGSLTGIGTYALRHNTSGSGNTALGYQTLIKNTSGSGNNAFGYGALAQNSTGNYNTAIGNNALAGGDRYTTPEDGSVGKKIGDDNVAVGYHALMFAGGANNNVAVGSGALSGSATNSVTGSKNIAVGKSAAKNITSGEGNISLGYESLKVNTTGDNNIAIGTAALENSEKGSNNIAIGSNSCTNVYDKSNVICIGKSSGPGYNKPNIANNESAIYLGNSNSYVYIPGNLIIGGVLQVNNTLYVGPKDEKTIYLSLSNRAYSTYKLEYGAANNFVVRGSGMATMPSTDDITSDRRLKNVKGENTAGLEEVRKLKVFDYTFKKDENKTPRVGVMAQDLEKIFPNAVTKGDDGYLRIRMEDMFYAVINAVKQLDKLVQEVVEDVKELVNRVNTHDSEIEQLKRENAELKARMDKLEKLIK